MMSCSSGSLVLLGLVALACVATIRGSSELSDKDLRKNYAKLNKHLAKNVKSEDARTNMAEIERLLREPSGCFSFGSGGFRETLRRLVEFAELPSNSANVCKLAKKTELAEFIDSGLAEKSRSQDANYPLTRLDKIIEYYAYEVPLLLCIYDKHHPAMNYGYKRLAYDEINKRLVDELPGDDDIARNMLKAEEMLQGLASNGALADALRQLIKLKLTLNAEYCNVRGYEILFKNDLATRRLAHLGHDTPRRRVDKIYQHFARRHEEICRPHIVETFKRIVRRLSPETYRRVLGLIGTKYVEPERFPELLDVLSRKEIDEKFYTSSMVEALRDRIRSYSDERHFDLNNLFSDGSELDRIHEYLKLLSRNDADSTALELVEDEHKGKLRLDEEGLERVVRNYLFEACDEFLAMFGALVRADNFDVAINILHTHTTKSTWLDGLTYHTIRVGYKLCLHVRFKLVESLKSKISHQKYYY